MGQVPFYPPNVSGWKQGPGVPQHQHRARLLDGGRLPARNTVSDPGTQTPDEAVSERSKAVAGPGCRGRPRRKLQATPQAYEPGTRRWTPTSGWSARGADRGPAAGRPGRATPLTTEMRGEMSSCGCNDWKSTHRRAMLARQGERVPMPRAVLEGETAGHLAARLPAQRRGRASSRCTARQALSWGRIWETAAARAATPSTDPIIVSIFLDGGNDGLNTLVPMTGADYSAYSHQAPAHQARPRHLPAAGRAGSPAPDFAWNPAATGFKQLYDAGKMAVMPAVDYQPPDLVALPLPRLLAGGRARSRARRPAGWAGGSTRTASPTTRCRRSRWTGRWTAR